VCVYVCIYCLYTYKHMFLCVCLAMSWYFDKDTGVLRTILNFIHFKEYRQHSWFRQLYKTNS